MRRPEDELEQLRQRDLYRDISTVLGAGQSARTRISGRPMLNFSSNDYLGLSDSDTLKAAFAEAVERFGVGAGASRLVCGTQSPHQQLEDTLADFLGKPRALTFATGFAAAGGVLGAVLGKGDVVILDKLCHASLVDGARASGATLRVFPHGNLEKLESHLRWARGQVDGSGRVLIVAEAVFSMDGDRADLAAIVALKEKFEAWLLVDEAHAFGIIGDQGRGLSHELGVAAGVDLLMGTLGKAAGVAGGFVAADGATIELIVNRARSFIYSTAPPAAQAAAATAAIGVFSSVRGDELRSKLWSNIRLLDPDASSAIVPRVIGDEAEAMNVARKLGDAGFLIPAIRYPTVARGSARLRITLSSAHVPEDVLGLVDVLG